MKEEKDCSSKVGTRVKAENCCSTVCFRVTGYKRSCYLVVRSTECKRRSFKHNRTSKEVRGLQDEGMSRSAGGHTQNSEGWSTSERDRRRQPEPISICTRGRGLHFDERSGRLGEQRLQFEGKIASAGWRGLQIEERGRSNGGRGLQFECMQTS